MTHPPANAPAPRTLRVDFLYLDLTTCDRCRGTERNLDAALALVRPVLAATGHDVTVQRTLVADEAQARRLGFVSSPTVRIDGRDIAPQLRESTCDACSDLACDATACRVWVHRGVEHTAAPVALLVEAMLGAAYGDHAAAAAAPPHAVPDNLRRFFAGRQARGAACCGPAAAGGACCDGAGDRPDACCDAGDAPAAASPCCPK